MTHPDDDEWEYNPHFGCMMKKWNPSQKFREQCNEYLRIEAMENNDPPSAKNLERIRLEPAPKAENISFQPIPELVQLPEDFLRAITIGPFGDEPKDEGYCGIFGAETGKRDPFHWVCSTLHDPRYQALLDGKDPGRTNVQTQWDFTKGILSTMAEGLYAVVTGPFYILFGAWTGGVLRFTQLQRRQAAKEGKPWPKNETED